MIKLIPQAQAAITNPKIGALGDAAAAADPQTSFTGWLARLSEVALGLGALLAFFYMVWGGIDWITSGGDKGKLESARNKVIQSALGLIVLAAAYAIFFLITNLLGIKGGTTLYVQQLYRSYAPVSTYDAQNVVRN